VLSVDVKLEGGKYYIFTAAGRVNTGLDALDYLKRGLDLGAGELVINSIDADGVKNGFDLPQLKKVCEFSTVPVIASGGAGSVRHFIDLLTGLPKVDAALAASVFHFGEISIGNLKQELRSSGVEVRL
jgi:cyclase